MGFETNDRYTTEYNPTIKRNRLLIRATTWINPKFVMLTEKKAHLKRLYIVEFHFIHEIMDLYRD